MTHNHLTKALLMFVATYRRFLSPLLGARCRYYPTCSGYAMDALYWYQTRGLWLIARRLMRCHPWGGFGVDFVPIPLKVFDFVPSNNHRYHFGLIDKESYGRHLGRRFGIKR